jgi:hypothetical protein
MITRAVRVKGGYRQWLVGPYPGAFELLAKGVIDTPLHA